MHNDTVIDTITSELNIKKPLIAIKVWEHMPDTIPQYEGNAFPGMCTQIGEVIETGKTFHTNRDHCFCTGGVVATGVAPPISDEEREEMIAVHFEMSKSYKDVATALKYEHELDKIKPPVEKKNAAVQLGLLRDIEAPDLVLIFCTPAAADILNRTYTYTHGEPVRGFGGNGGCPFVIQYPYVSGKPSFTYSDVAWRKYIGLLDEELTVCFPYQSLVSFIDSLPFVAGQYRDYGEPVEE